MNAPLHIAYDLAAFAGAIVLLGGCTTYRFKVDAIRAPDGSSGASYRLESAHREYASDDLRFRDTAEFVKTALSSKGMFEVSPGATPDMVVEVDFGIEDAHTVRWIVPFDTPFDGGMLVTVVLYKKYLRITARDGPGQAANHPPRELWSTYVTTEDEDDDLRKYVPLLVSAAMDSIDSDTAGQKRIAIRPNDERVAFVKAGM